ncbi:helix-turn-helix domain-containing protein [Acidianus sulfidivorans JP7]|nr:helix-turn-helix domain-containing protein [Acidianus sulfidivorans]AWR97999.2 helix-turn-helix domain-containing protein [Acidianus sulfidivorans JP7]
MNFEGHGKSKLVARHVVLLLVFTLLFPMLSFSFTPSLVVYYNGTVIAHANKGEFYLVGKNITNLIILNSKYNISNNTVYLYNYSTIEYNAAFPKGIIKVQEPYNLSITILIPSTSDISYVSPAPTSFVERNGLFNFTFYSSNVLILYSLPTTYTTNNNKNNESLNLLVILIIAGLILTNSVLGYVLYLFRKMKSEDKNNKTEIIESTLNDRDLLVLNAINSGANTLSEIIKVTKLPKTTAYRRLKKLVSLGYIQEVRKDGKIYYIAIKKD